MQSHLLHGMDAPGLLTGLTEHLRILCAHEAAGHLNEMQILIC